MKRLWNYRGERQLQTSLTFDFFWFNFLLLLLMAGIFIIVMVDLDFRVKSDRILDPDLKFEAKFYVNDTEDLIETNRLVKSGGWLEELDEERRVIKVQGIKQDDLNQYSESELLAQLENRSEQLYYYSLAVLDQNETSRYLILKMPRENVGITVQDVQSNSESVPPFYLYLFVWIGLMLLLIFVYSYWVARRINKPLNQISKGLNRMIEGDYSTRISLEAEKEFIQIRDTFNYMAGVIEETSAEKKHAEESKQRLIVDLSHDLKTPITSIQGFAQALYEGRVEDHERQQRYLSYIYHKSIQVTRLIHNMLDLLKTDSPDYLVKIERNEMNDFLREVVADIYGDIEQKKFILELNIPNERVYAVYDSELLSSVIRNLIANALTHNPTGTCLRLELISFDDDVVIEIADTGVGIPKQLRSTMFEPFVRGDESRTGNIGTGLGLSIAMRNTEKMGGTLELREHSKEVTLFTIRLKKN
ncbi:sensor histidine kinase [Paenibacillus sp. IHBB 10380]|uniref:sensor histidine kinase n=1 Tax=Paenibacillus sp. IHBB 10380 TaxID=1566358 RepID=UPI0005CFB090|nr:HAMP domain-containing sensor histidine kinase [Paenibacillus sp. IHBB 10380]AJS58830.1 histidine kinase [Paenibacillus sp. IHBB 10380]